MAEPTKEEIIELEKSLTNSQFSLAIEKAFNAGYNKGELPPLKIWRNILLMAKGVLKQDLPKD